MGKSASKQFNNEVLKAHNEYRRQHGVPPLKLCSKLNREAQQYSEALASTRILKHSPESSRGQCGENLAWASYDQTGKEVADRWYSEIKNYNFQQPGFTSGTGHFTAMVWKNTKKMGVGKASASDGPPLWWPDTSQQGMLSTLASSKKMFCLQRSNLWSRTGRCESKNTDVKCPRTMSDSYVSVPVDVCAWFVMHVGIAWAHFVDIQLTD